MFGFRQIELSKTDPVDRSSFCRPRRFDAPDCPSEAAGVSAVPHVRADVNLRVLHAAHLQVSIVHAIMAHEHGCKDTCAGGANTFQMGECETTHAETIVR